MRYHVHIKWIVLSLCAMLCLLMSCQISDNENSDKVLQKKKPLPKKTTTRLNRISTAKAVTIAEAQFRKYLPKILTANDAYLDSQDTFTGDFTGDGLADVAIYFSLAPNEGGNTIVAQGLALYQNDGTDVKVIGGYEPNYLFSFLKIENGKIYVEKLAYAATDGRCCPSIKTEHALTIANGKVY